MQSFRSSLPHTKWWWCLLLRPTDACTYVPDSTYMGRPMDVMYVGAGLGAVFIYLRRVIS